MDQPKPRNKVLPPAAGMGRIKGSLNKTTALLKDAILMAADQAGGADGLVGYLRTQAAANPAQFMTLLGKVLPLQVNGSLDGRMTIKVVTGVPRADD